MKAEGHLHREEEICVNITAFGDDDVHVRAIAELVMGVRSTISRMAVN